MCITESVDSPLGRSVSLRRKEVPKWPGAGRQVPTSYYYLKFDTEQCCGSQSWIIFQVRPFWPEETKFLVNYKFKVVEFVGDYIVIYSVVDLLRFDADSDSDPDPTPSFTLVLEWENVLTFVLSSASLHCFIFLVSVTCLNFQLS